MLRSFKSLFRVLVLCAVAGGVSGCTGWVERQVATAERALNCAVTATAPVPMTSETAHCASHPAARS